MTDVLERLRGDGLCLEEYPDQTVEMCLAAVIETGWALDYVRITERHYDICLAAVQQEGLALQYVKKYAISREQYAQLCREAIAANAFAIEYVQPQTAELCLLAVQQEGAVLEVVRKHEVAPQYPAICAAAVAQDELAIDFADMEDPDVLERVGRNRADALSFVLSRTYLMCLIAVQQHWEELRYVIPADVLSHYYELCVMALEQSYQALEYVQTDHVVGNRYDELCLMAVRQNAAALQYIPLEKLSPEVMAAAGM